MSSEDSEDNDESDVRSVEEEEDAIRPEHIRAVRLGHGANCSSVGSVIDTLFVSAAIGGAIFAVICAALRDGEVVRVVDPSSSPKKKPVGDASNES